MDIGALGDTVSLARKSKLNKSLGKPGSTLLPGVSSSSSATLASVKSKIGPKGLINPSTTNKMITTGTFSNASSSSSMNTIRPSQLAATLLGPAPIATSATHRTEIIELLNMADHTNQTECSVDVDKPLFAPLPPCIEFRHYEPFEPVTHRLSFRNMDRFPRRVRVMVPDTPYFSISGPRNGKGTEMVDSRIAPGTEVHYTVTFTPREVDDYNYELIVVTEREKFLVPLRALGKRGLLSFSDNVSFVSTPVKSTTSKTFVVRNTGTRAAEFALSAPAPFKVTPERGYVEVDQNVPVTVSFTPTEAKEYNAELNISYVMEGYEASVAVKGIGHDIPVTLSTDKAPFPLTYVSLSNQIRFTLKNESDIPIHFSWKSHADPEHELTERLRRIHALDAEEAKEQQAILDAPDDETLDVDGDGEDDLSESDEEDLPENFLNDGSIIARGRQTSTLSTHTGLFSTNHNNTVVTSSTLSMPNNNQLELIQNEMGMSNGDGFVLGNHSSMDSNQGQLYQTNPANITSNNNHNHNNTSASPVQRVSVAKRAQLVALKRKFRNLRQTAETEHFNFHSHVYDITPSNGTLWAQSVMEFTIMFKPNGDAQFDTFAYLDVTGRSERLPLAITGRGMGPKLTFAYDVVDVGDVTVTSRHRYELRLMNKGEIDARWHLLVPRTPFGERFHFEPGAGHIKVGEEIVIDAYFGSDEMGDFSEEFRLQMEGTNEYVKLLFSGRVIAPPFQFDIDDFNFGQTPFSFTQTRRFAIYNTSDVPFTYNLRVPQDGIIDLPPDSKSSRRGKNGVPTKPPHPKYEFLLTPATGTIAPGGFHNITMDFTPTTLKNYEGYHLTVDMEHVGTNLCAVPIVGECIISNVEIVTPTVNYGDCFLRYPYSLPITLRNDGIVPAAYEVLRQDIHTSTVASFTLDQPTGVIPAQGTLQLMVALSVQKPGPASIPVYIRILGRTGDPLKAECQAKGRGPRIVPIPRSVDFGSVPCLTPGTQELILHNDSYIPAKIQCFMKGERSRFSADTIEATLAPDEKRVIKLTAVLDDTIVHTDDVCVNVIECEPLLVPVAARGVGTTMVSDVDNMNTIDFGQVFTTGTRTFVFNFENRGKRSQTLSWQNISQRMKELNVKKEMQNRGKNKNQANTTTGGGKPSNVSSSALTVTPSVFNIEPSFAVVKPRGSITFTFTCSFTDPSVQAEQFECISKPEGETNGTTIYQTLVKAEFVNPLLQFDRNDVSFAHMHIGELDTIDPTTGMLPSVLQTEPLTLTNASGLPLDFTLRTAPPFSLDAYEFNLTAGASAVVNVTFDPLYRDDRTSHTIEGRLTAIYKDHPRRDGVRLLAEVQFPNVALERNSIDFGCVLNDTTTSQLIRVANTSKLPVSMAWSFVEDADTAAAAAALIKQPYVPINQVFDILPIRCNLLPGETRAVEFIFYGHPGRKFEGKAVCEVSGGPDYEMTLTGEASIVSYRLDRALLDFGRLLWDKAEDQDFIIYNSGKVDYNFSVATDTVSRPGIISVTPTSGTVPAGGKQKVKVFLRAGAPGRLQETIVVSVAHFAPIDVTIVAESVFGVVSANLPREPGSVVGFEEALAIAKDEVLRQRAERDAANAMIYASTVGLSSIAEDGQQSVFGEGSASNSSAIGPLVADIQRTGTNVAPPVPRSVAGSRVGFGVNGPKSVVQGGSVVGSKVQTLATGPVIPLAMEIEAEAARSLFSKHLLSYVTAERNLAIAERNAGIRRRHTELALEEQDSGLDFDSNDNTEEKKDDNDRRNGKTKNNSNTITINANATVPPAPPAALVSARENLKALVAPAKYVVARYIVDLGNVIIGTTRRRTFTVTNSGKTSASFTIDRSLFASSGFEIEPGKVQRLPEGETMNFEVSFTAQPLPDREGGIGLLTVDVPVAIAKGPSIIFCLRANVTIPDIRISPELIDFSSVLRGQERTCSFQLHNFSPVQAVWNIGNPIGAPPQVRDKEYFRFSPTEGTLAPGERTMVKVAFIPSESRNYGISFPLKIAQNSIRNRSVYLRGQGDDAKVSFALSPVQDLFVAAGLVTAPIDPFATALTGTKGPNGSSNNSVATGNNLSLTSVPTAVRKNFNATGKTNATVTNLPPPLHVEFGPQVPSDSLGYKIVTMTNNSALPMEIFSLDYDTKYRAEESILALTDGYDDTNTLRIPVRTPGDNLPAEYVLSARSKDPNAGAPTIPENYGIDQSNTGPVTEIPVCPPNRPRAQGLALNILVTGPPGSGVSTQARAIGEALACPVVTLDSVIAWARSGAGGTAIAQQVSAVYDPLVDQAILESENHAKAIIEANAAAAKDKKNKAAPAPVPPVLTPDQVFPPLPSELLTAVLASRINRIDCSQAIIVDGLNCRHLTDAAEGAKIIASVLANRKAGVLRIVSLTMDNAALTARHNEILAQLRKEITDVEQQYHLPPPDSTESSTVPPPTGPDGQPLSEEEHKRLIDSGTAVRNALHSTVSRIRSLVENPTVVTSYTDTRPALIDTLTQPLTKPSKVSVPPADSLDSSMEVEHKDGEGKRSDSPVLGDNESVSIPDNEDDNGSVRTESVVAEPVNVADLVIEVHGGDNTEAVKSIILSSLPPLPEEPNAFNSDLDLDPPSTVILQRRPTGVGRVGRPSPEATAKFRISKLDEFVTELLGGANAVEGIKEQLRAYRETMTKLVEQIQHDPSTRPSDVPPVPSAPTASADAMRTFLYGGDFTESPLSQPLRWVLKPGETTQFVVRFGSGAVGSFTSNFGFGLVGVPREFTFTARGVCAVPTIASDPSHIFPSRMKARGDRAIVSRKFILSRNVYEFGPLIAGRSKKDREGYKPPLSSHEHHGVTDHHTTHPHHPSTPHSSRHHHHETQSPEALRLAREVAREKAYFNQVKALHAEHIKLTNNCPFPATIALSLAGPDAAVPYHRNTPYVTTPATPLAVNVKPPSAPSPAYQDPHTIETKTHGTVETADSCFVIEPAMIENLAPGASTEVTVWSFPPSSGVSASDTKIAGTTFMNSLVVSIGHNPDPFVYPLSAIGTSPGIELHGPWENAPPKEVTPATAPSPVKGKGGVDPGTATRTLDPNTMLIDFDRQLVEHSEDKGFTVTNTSLTPIQWRIDTSGFLETSTPAPAVPAPTEKGKSPAPSEKNRSPSPGPSTDTLSSSTVSTTPVFMVTPTSGTLAPGQTANVTVNFASANEVIKQCFMKFEYTDAECGFEYITDSPGTGDRPSTTGKTPAPAPGKAPAPSPAVSSSTTAAVPRSVLLSAPLAVQGEAYRVVSGIRFEEVDSGRPPTRSGADETKVAGGPGHFDFGLLRVGDSAVRTLPLSNNGKYPINYRVGLYKPPVGEDMFTISPSEGTINAGESVRVEFTFKAANEVRLVRSKLLVVQIMDTRSNAIVDSVPVSVSATTTFSKWSFVPSKGLNFGAIRYGTDKERKIEIKNVGSFPWTYTIVPAHSDEDKKLLITTEGKTVEPVVSASNAGTVSKPGTAVGGNRPSSAKGKGTAPSPSPTTTIPTGDGDVSKFGRFTVEPQTGTVPPNGTALVSVKFFATGAAVYRSTVRIHISGFDHISEKSDALLYELVGESCVPGINANDWPGIFEEQTCVNQLDELLSTVHVDMDTANAVPSSYPQGSPSASPQRSPDSSFIGSGSMVGGKSGLDGSALSSRTRAGFSIIDRIFSFGTVIPTQHPRGVVERFRISNPTKVPIAVTFNLKGEDAGTSFTLTPNAADILPHESRYVEVRFTPTAIRKYNAVFTAEVDAGTLPDTRRCEFSLTGEGALPSVVLLDPPATTRDGHEGVLVMDLGAVQAGKSKSRSIVVRNDGVFPAIAKFELPFSRVFKLIGGGSTDSLLDGTFGYMSATATSGKQVSVTLQPGQQGSVGVAFVPDMDAVLGDPQTAPGMHGYDDDGSALYASDIRVTVMHNPYEQERVRLKGTACLQDMVIEGLTSLHDAETQGLVPPRGAPEIHGTDHSQPSSPIDILNQELLIFKDVDMNDKNGSVATVTLLNRSERPLRFEFPSVHPEHSSSAVDASTLPAHLSYFTFSPRIGHLPVGARKSVTVKFTAVGGDHTNPTPVKLENVPLPLTFSKVTYEPMAAKAATHERSVQEVNRPSSASSTATKKSAGKDSKDPKGGAPSKAPPGKAPAPAPAPTKGGKPASRPPTASATAVTPSEPSKRVRRPRQVVANEPPHDWDSNMVTVSYLPASHPEAVNALASGIGVIEGAQVRITRTNPEPPYAVINDGGPFMDEHAHGDGAPSSSSSPSSVAKVVPVAEEAHALHTVNIPVRAVADSIRYEVTGDDTVAHSRSITFKPTLMFQTRAHTFTLRNPAVTGLRYDWTLSPSHGETTHIIGTVPNVLPFTIEPANGYLAPGETKTFTVNFAPMEAEDYDAIARMHIDGAASNLAPLQISISGRAQRPIVHMDVPFSDYLSRRSPAMPGPNGEVGGLDANVRVIDIPSLGIGNRNAKRFYIVNPTDASYDFIIEPIGAAASATCPIKCLTTRGMLLPGKRFELTFEFTPVVSNTQEAFFRYAIPSHNVSQLFLVAGTVTEPRVSLTRNSLQFRHLLIGARSTEVVHIVNEESTPFAFDFLPQSYEAEKNAILITPSTGVIPAHGKLPVEVTFAPTEERAINANIQCMVRRKPLPLHLNVKGEGYDVHDRIEVHDETASAGTVAIAPELSSTGINFLDFGTVQVNERAMKRIIITNNGTFSFDFSWTFASDVGGSGAMGARALAATLRTARSTTMGALPPGIRPIRVTPESGKVPKGGQVICDLEFRPTSQITINNMNLVCTVANVKRYQVSLSATGGKPSLEFSAHAVEFGECILPPVTGIAAIPVTKTIRITNREADRDISLQCMFERKSHLDVGCDALVLRPGDTVEVPFTFTPRQPMSYAENVAFEVNGLHTVYVAVSGEGTPCAIELANPSQTEVAFGSLRPGQNATRSLKLANRSKRGIVMDIIDDSVPSNTIATIESANTLAKLNAKSVTVSNRRLMIKGRDAGTFEFRFSPGARIPSFREPIYARIANAGPGGSIYGSFSDRIPLVSVTGASLGMDVMLEVDTLTFGPVCEGSRLTKTVQLYNGGDLPTQFRFDTAALGKEFTLIPSHGFLPPQSDVPISVTFNPTRLGKNIRIDGIRCTIEGAADSLLLALTGDCVPRPSPTGTPLVFNCRVRESVTQTITLPKNETDKPWSLVPVISNEFWTGPVTVDVPAKGTNTYTVTYKPLLMTKDNGPTDPPPLLPGVDPALIQVGLSVHTGSIFFPLPDGTGVLYTLQGKATPPAVAETIPVKTSAKKVTNFVVPLTNWMRITQRFTVSWDTKILPPSAQLKGARTLDVPGLGTREYKLSFLPALEGKYTLPITFTNEATGEFITYNLDFEVSAPGSAGSLVLEAVVRTPVSTTINIPNPLANSNTPITWAPPQVDHPAVRVVKLGDMTGQQEGLFRVDYRPLVPTGTGEAHHASATNASAPPTRPPSGTKKPGTAASTKGGNATDTGAHIPADSNVAHITLHSDQLGDFTYTVKLSATAPGSEPALRFSAPLGGKQSSIFRFRSYDTKNNTANGGVYHCTVTRPDLFTVPPTVTLPAPPTGADPWDGVDGSIEVTYEGTGLGDYQAEMHIVSESGQGGSYTVPLIATCLPPRPAGPFVITPNGTTTVDFRNIFNEDREFVITTDNPILFTPTPNGTLALGKKSSTSISVKYTPPVSPEAAAMGPGGKLVVTCPSLPDVPSWIYYLKGEAIPLSSSSSSNGGTSGTASRAASASRKPDAGKKK